MDIDKGFQIFELLWQIISWKMLTIQLRRYDTIAVRIILRTFS